MENNELDKFAPVLKDKAIAIYDETKDPNSIEFDPFTIIMIIGLIVNLIKLYKECNKKDTEVLDSIKKPGLINRMILKRQIRKLETKLDKHKLEDGFHKVAQTFNLEEVKSLFEVVI